MMHRIVLGRTESSVSVISLGTWSYGGENTSNNQPVGWAGQTDKDSKQVLLACWDNGINHWDTADVYGDGRSEKVIGAMWKKLPREDIFLASKVGWDKGKYAHWYHPVQMKKNMERSLKNLKTDCLDLLYLHHCNFGKNDEYFDDALATVRAFQQEGKTRFIGLSDWYSEKIMKYIERCDPDVVQPYRNVWDDTYEISGLKKYVESNNLGVCFFSPLMHGLLTGKYSMPPIFPEGDFRSTIGAFKKQAIINKMKENAFLLTDRFFDRPQPILHGVVDALHSDSKNSCVLLGQRNLRQFNAAMALGKNLSPIDLKFVRSLYVH